MAVEQDIFSIGIDLGTTYSSIAYCKSKNNEINIIQDEQNKNQVASWVSLSQLGNNGNTIVGNSAKDDIHSECIIYDSKRIIGRDESDVNYEDRDNWPFKVKSRNNGRAYIECYNPQTQGAEEFEPEEISGMILKHLYDKAQMKISNNAITNVVITVPVDFNDKQRDATLLACQLAGIKNVTLENEPTAAIVEYKREYPNSLKEGDRVVIIDFGGGTLDVACCKIGSDNNVNVESNGGDQDLGGNDFDKVMIDIIKKKVEKDIPGYYEKKRGMTQKAKIMYKKKLIRLKKEAERVKVELSDRTNNELAKKEVKTTKDIMTEVELELDSLLGKEHSDEIIGTIITRKKFEEECEERGLYERFINKIKQVTQRKGYKKGNVKLVLLIGGTCKMPRIREEVSNLFGEVIFSNNNFNPLTAVVKGAAYLSYLKQVNAIGHETVYDSVPIPIGIEVEGGKFEILVKDGETLPTKGTTREYCTTRDNQTSADFIIYRGFGKYVSSLGVERVTKLSINGIPSGKREEQKFKFTIHINTNGMMEISASLVGGNIKEELSTSLDLSKTEQEIERLIKHFQKFY
ncbi:hypothetical protein ENUP19_0388G0015 [Entamoeba nuttalli]|uniref:Heat shock protein 70 n=1 Tax=Entamoeba nuttalli TaxID=412467 RepID=A0ABQ0DZP9_9EUKA